MKIIDYISKMILNGKLTKVITIGSALKTSKRHYLVFYVCTLGQSGEEQDNVKSKHISSDTLPFLRARKKLIGGNH